MNDNALAVIDSALTVARPARDVLTEAHEAAKALKEVIDAKAKKVQFNGETYLEFEDWQTVGRFYGIAPRITQTKYVEFGAVSGWEASADAIHVPTGRIVSSADAMCLNDEEKWRSRPKYGYAYVTKAGTHEVEDPGPDQIVWEDNPYKQGKKRPKKERVQIGEENVPLFQLRSMAQTRAAAKALRNALAWVVVLAGYRPTPAEELPVLDATPATIVAPAATEAPQEGKDEVPFHYVPPRAKKAAVVDTETGEIKDAPDSEVIALERKALALKANKLREAVGLDDDAAKVAWTTYCGKATKDNVDPAALQGLVSWLETRLAAKRGAA